MISSEESTWQGAEKVILVSKVIRPFNFIISCCILSGFGKRPDPEWNSFDVVVKAYDRQTGLWDVRCSNCQTKYK